MANGRGGSRIGGFIRGVLAGLVVCAIAAVALSLSAPTPDRGPIGGVPDAPGGIPGGASGEEAGPAAVEPEAALPASDASPTAEPEPAERSVVPQATSPQAAPETGDAGPPAGESDAFTTPQSPIGSPAQ